MAFHALVCDWECHQPTGFRVGVAILAFQAKCEMFFVAVWDGLVGSGVLGGIIGDHLPRRRWCRLLRSEPQREAKKRSEHRRSCEQYDIFGLHSRLLVETRITPQSLAFRFSCRPLVRCSCRNP